jgi:hypothetical protein
MSSVTVHIKHGEKEVNLQTIEANNTQKMAIIGGVFGLFGVGQDVRDMLETYQKIGQAYKSFFDQVKQEEPKELHPKAETKPLVLHEGRKSQEPFEPKDDEVKSGRTRRIKLLNSERTLTSSLGEKLAEAIEKATETPEWYETGIKYKDGVPHYRCRYWCKNPDCRNQGNHYITEHETEVECHNCGERLAVRPSTIEGFPKRDQYGNYFRADQPIQQM